MLYREIMAVCSEIHTNHINTVCGQNVELLNVKPDVTYSNHWDLKDKNKRLQYLPSCLSFTSSVLFSQNDFVCLV